MTNTQNKPVDMATLSHNPDAAAWAAAFKATHPAIEEGLMLGWFANAMMAMHDHLMQKHEWNTRHASTDNALRKALEGSWSWACPETGTGHDNRGQEDCPDCGLPVCIEPDWENAETCIENVMLAYVNESACDEDGPVDTVVSSGDLYVLLSLAGAAYHARAALADTPKQTKPWCETCGKDVHEVLCPTCAKWWNDNPPPNDALREDLIRADYEWHGPFGKEKHRIIPPALFDRILAVLEGKRTLAAFEGEG